MRLGGIDELVRIGIVYGKVYEARGVNVERTVDLLNYFANFAENCTEFQLRRKLCRQLHRNLRDKSDGPATFHL